MISEVFVNFVKQNGNHISIVKNKISMIETIMDILGLHNVGVRIDHQDKPQYLGTYNTPERCNEVVKEIKIAIELGKVSYQMPIE